MREIIATVISIISCIVYLVIVPRKILMLPKILTSSASTDKQAQTNKSYTTTRETNEICSGLCAIVSFFAFALNVKNIEEQEFFVAFLCITVILCFFFALLLSMFYKKIERIYNVQKIKRGRDTRLTEWFAPFTVGLAVYQIVLLFL